MKNKVKKHSIFFFLFLDVIIKVCSDLLVIHCPRSSHFILVRHGECMVEGDRCDGCHRRGRGTREGGRMGIGGVVHRHNAVHRIGPDRMLNLSMCINRVPARERENRERKCEDRQRKSPSVSQP